MAGLKAFRLSKRRYAEQAFSGEGARVLGGRWNSVDVPVVYASLSLSLAVLEVFVHMTATAQPDDYVYVAVDLGIEESQVERVHPEVLPEDWNRLEHPALRAIGDEWARSRRSLALLVPSVIIPGEWNVVINPMHQGAAGMRRGDPIAFRFDERLFQTR